jgi:hypothetical protein
MRCIYCAVDGSSRSEGPAAGYGAMTTQIIEVQAIRCSCWKGVRAQARGSVDGRAICMPRLSRTVVLVEYAGGNDHHLGQLDVQVAVPSGGINGATVTIEVAYGLRDWSGNWDDQYDGTINFAVIGE